MFDHDADRRRGAGLRLETPLAREEPALTEDHLFLRALAAADARIAELKRENESLRGRAADLREMLTNFEKKYGELVERMVRPPQMRGGAVTVYNNGIPYSRGAVGATGATGHGPMGCRPALKNEPEVINKAHIAYVVENVGQRAWSPHDLWPFLASLDGA